MLSTFGVVTYFKAVEPFIVRVYTGMLVPCMLQHICLYVTTHMPQGQAVSDNHLV